MKNVLILLLTIPLFSLTTVNDTNRFVGKWIGEDKGEMGYISFDNEGYVFFEIDGQIHGGKEFMFKGKKGKMTYEIKEGTNPIQIDLVVTIFESGEQKKLLCIANFIDDNTMRFAINFENKRPVEFNAKNTITLKREK